MKRIIRIISVLLLAVGVGIASYPHVRQWQYTQSVHTIIGQYDRWRSQERTQEEQLQWEQLYEAMQAYNQGLYEHGQSGFRDAWSYQQPSFDLAAWGVETDMVGYVEIEKMGIELPIYLGATTENMKKGAVHLSQTSLPIGGENTNCVLAAHRGYANAAMFRDIQRLEVGDVVRVTNLWETLAYQVWDIQIIDPDDVQQVLIQPGKDLLTLITCHPYGYDTYRYVVYCQRLDGSATQTA